MEVGISLLVLVGLLLLMNGKGWYGKRVRAGPLMEHYACTKYEVSFFNYIHYARRYGTCRDVFFILFFSSSLAQNISTIAAYMVIWPPRLVRGSTKLKQELGTSTLGR